MSACSNSKVVVFLWFKSSIFCICFFQFKVVGCYWFNSGLCSVRFFHFKVHSVPWGQLKHLYHLHFFNSKFVVSSWCNSSHFVSVYGILLVQLRHLVMSACAVHHNLGCTVLFICLKSVSCPHFSWTERTPKWQLQIRRGYLANQCDSQYKHLSTLQTLDWKKRTVHTLWTNEEDSTTQVVVNWTSRHYQMP